MQENVRPVRWGIISSANIGVNAVGPAIIASSNGKLVAIGSRNTLKARDAYKFAGGARLYKNYNDVINDSEVEAIYNPLPNSLHAEWTIKALQAGKHVLCEKPMATTASEAEAMIEVARANNVLLMEAFMYRFHPQTVWVLEQVRSGVIGTVRQVKATFSYDVRSNMDNIRVSAELAGGSLMDVGCYPINFCRAVYGRPPISVAARVHVAQEGGVDMAAAAVLDYGDGQFGIIDSSMEQIHRQQAEIIGDQGMITVPVPFVPGNYQATVLLVKQGQMTEHNFGPIDQYQLQVEHFADCIRTGQQPARALPETVENIRTIEQVYQAAGFTWPIPGHDWPRVR